MKTDQLSNPEASVDDSFRSHLINDSKVPTAVSMRTYCDRVRFLSVWMCGEIVEQGNGRVASAASIWGQPAHNDTIRYYVGRMYIIIYVCMHVCWYVCMNVWIYGCMYVVRLNEFIYVSIWLQIVWLLSTILHTPAIINSITYQRIYQTNLWKCEILVHPTSIYCTSTRIYMNIQLSS